MYTFINWLVLSSKDSTKVSLTVKSALTGVVTVLTVFAGLSHISLPNDQLTALVDAGVQIVQAVLIVISGVATFVGLARKLWHTFKGTNAVLNDPQLQ